MEKDMSYDKANFAVQSVMVKVLFCMGLVAALIFTMVFLVSVLSLIFTFAKLFGVNLL